MIVLKLPLPPSGNRSVRTGKGRHYTPRQIKAYRSELQIHRSRSIPTIGGEFRIAIVFHPYQAGRFDLDNRVKTLMDALQWNGFFLNDGDCVRMEIERGHIVKPAGAAVVTITV